MDKPFLVAIDFSELTERTVQQAAQLARGGQNRIDLLHVVHPAPVAARGNMAARAIAEKAQRAKIDNAKRKLETLMQTIPEELRGNCLVEVGIPADVICNAANGYGIAVLSTNGRTGLSHALIGSVAERVVRFCPVPVLVVR